MLQELFHAFGSRGLMITLLAGFAWTLSVVLLLLLGFVSALGWFGNPSLKLIGWSLLALSIVSVVIWKLVIPIGRLRHPDAIARHIGAVYPWIASDVLSASQLSRKPEVDGFATYLVAAHFRMVRESLTRLLPKGDVFPRRQLLFPAMVLTLVIGAALAVTRSFPQVTATGLDALFREQMLPEQGNRRILAKAPVVGDLAVVLKYPEYLTRPERRLDSISGGLVAPLGTTVLVEGKSLVKDAEKGEIHLPDGGRTTLSITETNDVRGSFVVGGEGAFFIALGDREVMVEGPERSIEIEPDAPPAIRLLRPSGRVELALDGTLVLEFESEDDHGVQYVDLVLRAGQQLELRKTIVRLSDQVKRFKTEYRWTPESVRIGDETELQLELEAYDNDTIRGPKPGRTEPLHVRFLTPQSRHRNAMEEQNQALDALIDLLAHRLESPVPTGKDKTEAAERFFVMQAETEDFLAKTAKIIGTLNRDTLCPKKVLDTFSEIRQNLSNQLLYESRLYQSETPGDYRSRIGVDRVTVRLLESALIRLDDLVIDQQLSRVVRTGGDLEAEREALTNLLLRYQNTRSEPVRRAVLDAIEQLEANVQRLQKSMERIRGKVGDTYLNPTSLIHMDLLGSLASLRSLIADDDISKALALVKRLEGDLGKLMAGLEGGLLSFRTERFGEGERFIEDLLERVIALESEQLQLRRETLALKRRYQERLTAVMKGKINPLVKRQLKRLDTIQRITSKLDAKNARNGAYLKRLRNATRELDLSLGQGDLEEARQVAKELTDIAADWLTIEGEKAPEALITVEQQAKQIHNEVAAAYPSPQQLLTDRDVRQARHKATTQRLLTAKARKLGGWIKKQGEETRFLSRRAQGTLSKVVKRMTRAAKGLETKQVSRAMDDQSAALDELASLREDLKRGDEVAPVESRPIVVNARVELPSPEEFEVPPEFRDDILKAMRGDLPKPYKDAIKKYYETLVQ